MSKSKSNVIDLFSRERIHPSRSTKAKTSGSAGPGRPSSKKSLSSQAAPVVDMSERRQEMLSDERRQVKRTILTEFIGAFAVIPQRGLIRVTLYDISDQGVAFDLEEGMGHFVVGEEVAMRVYLNHKTYFPFVVKIQNMRWDEIEQVQRHGANFLKDTVNEEALSHFVKFIETVSASLETDEGDVMVSNLNR